MKKALILLAALLGLGWLVKARFAAATASRSALASTTAELASPAPGSRASSTAGMIADVDAEAAEPVAASPTPAAPTAAFHPPMSLPEVLRPNNRFHDAVFGVSATYPEGWSVRRVLRWGRNHAENTVFFAPPEGSAAIPSMYYQMYPDGAPDFRNAEAVLREMAQKKEASRLERGLNDYQNDPGSFVFREIDGHPSLSYFATFTRGDQVHAEYFMRILGEKGYVMFFMRGPAIDVQVLIPSVHQMGATVSPP